jgi:hypothetical protein
MTVLEFVRTVARTEILAAKDDALFGIVIFCEIGLLVSLAALALGWFGEAAAVMF